MATIWSDNFNRTASNGWGSDWRATTSHYSVNGSVGVVTATTTGTLSNQKVTAPSNSEINFTFQAGKTTTPVGGEAGLRLIFRGNGTATEAYVVNLRTTTSSTLTIIIQSVSASTAPTTLTLGSTSGISISSGLQNYRIQVIGYKIRVKVWGIGAQEPSSWNLEVTDSNTLHASSGEYFNQVQHFTGSTNFSAFHFDNFTWTNSFPTAGATGVSLDIDTTAVKKASASTTVDLDLGIAGSSVKETSAAGGPELLIGAVGAEEKSVSSASVVDLDLSLLGALYKLGILDVSLDLNLQISGAPFLTLTTSSEIGLDLGIIATAIRSASTTLSLETSIEGTPVVPPKASSTEINVGLELQNAATKTASTSTTLEVLASISGQLATPPVFIEDTTLEALSLDTSLEPIEASTELTSVPLTTDLETV